MKNIQPIKKSNTQKHGTSAENHLRFVNIVVDYNCCSDNFYERIRTGITCKKILL